jgi:hypothetical protein
MFFRWFSCQFYFWIDTIELKDITANGLRAVLDFIYTGELTLSIENIGMFD